MLMVIFLMAKALFGNSGKSRLETTVWAIQLLLLSVGIISIILVFKTAVIPYSFSTVSTLPQLWLSLKFWLSPPYIYIIINFIIVFIAISSTFHYHKVNEDNHNDHFNDYDSPRLQQDGDGDYGGSLRQPLPPDTPSSSQEINHNTEEVDFLFSHETPPKVSPSPSLDKSGIDSLEKTTSEEIMEIPSSPEQIKHILVTEHLITNNNDLITNNNDDDFDTMEATWEAIVEAAKSPTKKQLKKMETWNAPPVVVAPSEKKEMRKLETFNGSVLGRQRGGLRRDVSMTQAELNNRVEAFISKFNMDMRLQRQESEQRFLEMINRR